MTALPGRRLFGKPPPGEGRLQRAGAAKDLGLPPRSRTARREIAKWVFQRLETEVPYDGKRHALKNIIQLRARLFAVAARGGGECRGFIVGW